MKPDALTIAVVVFVAGVLLSTGLTEVLASDPEPQAGLQQGVVTR